MIRILLHGACGRMGRAVAELAGEDESVRIAAGVDALWDNEGKTPEEHAGAFPMFSSLSQCDIEADAAVDFSTAAAADELLDFCAEKRLPCVLCTTGLSEAQLERLKEAAKKTAILRSANMSLGINLLCSLLTQISPLLTGEGFDVEILEKHHNRKLDAPSGTALALAEAVNKGLDFAYPCVFDRSDRRQKRPKAEIGISAIRGGTIVGEHEVFFAGEDEVITLSHTASSRRVFAKGALAAAKFLAGREPGLYSMADLFS